MYDLIVLGAGPAGYLAAQRAAAAGLSTLLIEKNHVGGVCLNEGCVPSKTILYSSKLYALASSSTAFGVTTKDARFDFTVVMERKQRVIETLRKGIETTLKKNKVTLVKGEGRILPKKGDVFCVKTGDQVYEASRLLICTGSEAIRLSVPGADLPFVYTNREVLGLKELPQSLVVIGGGAIGLELATFFAEVGVKVAVVELLPSIGGPIDTEISTILQKELEKKGILFKLRARVTGIGTDHKVRFVVDGKEESIVGDVVLMSVGRRPVSVSIGLENINVYCERGAIKTDEYGRTNIPRVWAAGDVNGISMLAHTAYREAEVCVNNMVGIPDRMRYNAIPAVIYTHPEVATVGITQAEAERQGYAVKALKIPLSYSGRYLAENEGGKGVCMVVIDRQYGRVLGVHMIGDPCSEIIFGAATMIANELRVDDIKATVFPHPTVSEIIKEAVSHT